jgi:DNA (cytosine-5)-methyltransferase 1
MASTPTRFSVVDIFCGAGGLSHGFKRAAFHIAGGIDADPACEYPYSQNNGPFFLKDVTKLDAEFVNGLFASADRKVLIGCAPCQAFSTYNQKNSRKDWNLLRYFVELARDVRPEYVAIENVPALQKFSDGKFLHECKDILQDAGYNLNEGLLFGPDYGLPQRRTRYVLIGRMNGKAPFPRPREVATPSLNSAIGDLRPIEAGQTDQNDPLHCAGRLSSINLRRIRASKQGGTWQDWPHELRSECHKRVSGDGYGAVYGRLRWDEPAPTMTTQYYNYGSGRFGHPDQDRGLSLREGAILQGFPREYDFHSPSQRPPIRSLGRLIGNAVPVPFGEAIAQAISAAIAGEV